MVMGPGLLALWLKNVLNSAYNKSIESHFYLWEILWDCRLSSWILHKQFVISKPDFRTSYIAFCLTFTFYNSLKNVCVQGEKVIVFDRTFPFLIRHPQYAGTKNLSFLHSWTLRLWKMFVVNFKLVLILTDSSADLDVAFLTSENSFQLGGTLQ